MSSRRELIQYALSLFGLAAIGCDDGTTEDDAGPGGGTDAGPGGGTDAGPGGGTDAGPGGGDGGGGGMCVMVAFTIGDDHTRPHAEGISFPAADVTAGVEKTYDIQGASLHPHTLTVTAADFAALARGEMVMITSSFDARHDHLVTLWCA